MGRMIFVAMIVFALLLAVLLFASTPVGQEWAATRFDDVRWFLNDVGVLRR